MEKHLRAAVVGATGYTGAEVVRLLLQHPAVQLTIVTSERNAGEPLGNSCPWLDTSLVLSKFDASLEADIVFLCQANGFAMKVAPQLKPRVVDLSGDFRLRDTALYPEWYGHEHACPGFSPWPVYGLPELVDRNEIKDAKIVSNPGCYVTASLLALAPLARAGLLRGTPTIDAKSGVSGAGRSTAETDHLLSELHGGFVAYKTTRHRHTPEIEQLFGSPVHFVPHLLPISRGICATTHVATDANSDEVKNVWSSAYKDEPFVRIVDSPPSTKLVHGTNMCLLFADYDSRTKTAVLVSVIDNLVKGAAGQAVQNMNIMFGLDETMGLTTQGVWP